MRKRNMCVYCGLLITKSGLSDPYMCRTCDSLIRNGTEIEPFRHLDV